MNTREKEFQIKKLLLQAQDEGWTGIPRNIPFDVKWDTGKLRMKITGKICEVHLRHVVEDDELLSAIIPAEKVPEFKFMHRNAWTKALESLILKSKQRHGQLTTD